MISIKLNSKDKQIEDGSSISDLLNFLDIKPEGIVVEVNLNIIRKEKYRDIVLKDGDCVEIITFLGGG